MVLFSCERGACDAILTIFELVGKIALRTIPAFLRPETELATCRIETCTDILTIIRHRRIINIFSLIGPIGVVHVVYFGSEST